MANIKVTDDEIKQIREVRNNYQQIMLQLGQVELQINDLQAAVREVEGAKQQLLGKYDEIKKDEREKMQELNKTYGPGNLNIETGILTPLPGQPEVPKQEPIIPGPPPVK